MDTLWYLGRLALAFAAGSLSATLLGRHRFVKTAATMQMVLVWLLLFFMGVNTASIEDIGSQMASIGLSALIITILALAGTIAVALLFSPRASDEEPIAIAKRKEGSLLRRLWDIIKEPLTLIAIVISGLLLGLYTPLFTWFDNAMISSLLYVMLFFVGMGMVQRKISFKGLFANKTLVFLPLFTIAGTYLGALAVPLFTPYTIKEAMGMLSGFGWYSLSGILISDLGYPLLGSVSFLSNLLRESFSFFLIPLFGRLGRRYYPAAVCSGGATTMDVTLVLLSGHFGMETMVASIYHGVVMSMVVPLLIPLFF